MTSQDATSIAQLATQLRLVTDEQVRECWDELDTGIHSPESLLKLLERKGYLTPWQSHKLLRGDSDGYFLGGYRVLYKIASGSFGRVFRADDPRTGADVAIKVLRRRWSEDPHKVELFEREGRMGMSMHHPNIVRILAVNQDKATGQHYIVMEFVEGGNLRDFLAIRKRLEVKEALRLLEECSSGLAYAYTRGLTHRDLKPTNVLIASQGSARLVDFGLAEIAIPEHGEQHDVSVERTVDYAGLEKATAVKHGDIRSDIYFMGCVFYEMLCGHAMLTQTRDRVARMNRHRYEDIPPISSYDVVLPPPVQGLLDRMIAFDPKVRYQTPAALHEAVRKVQGELEGGPIQRSAPAGPKSVFIVEGHPKFQDVFREHFAKQGLRPLISANPSTAIHKYEEQPYHALIVDAGTAGEAGVQALKRIVKESDDMDLTIAAVLVLEENQTDWAEQVPQHPGVAVLVRPGVTLKNLTEKLQEMLEQAETADA
ncbi:MAG TPA: serine/threonine-protein kinase [Gemmataceae bacterium]|jgi:serine/threonine protein kinase